ncbi:MAG: single-stranded-DNA-specific exonuclease RecJ [Clostridia bacterium]|nr:single-stranded-DNA-specific exonuclease RecJ [Clostridia bacterium]
MKKIIREFQFTPDEEAKVASLAEELNITRTTAGILYARGNDSAEKMRVFLHPSREHFLSPFLMRGMKEAVELLTRARDEEWRVAVFGDYDADGIGALAIMSRALTRFGIEPYLYVPERADGYGMSVEAIDKIFDEFLPDLLITVDCGISNAREVEYLKEQGAYVIVTDHHELPEELPDCIVINPKLADDYPYDNLCGAGVAWKLASALIGEEALGLLDFAALSTVADSVPLLGENRDIVAEGLKLIAHNPRRAIAELSGKGETTAQSLAFTVAPRINAAGRMGDAHAALDMFTSEDDDEIHALAEKLNGYNVARQKYCDEMYRVALAHIYADGAYGNIIMLAGENWSAGTVGIVAARIAEQFNRPALLFVKSGDMLRGSARSIDNVNIFEALKACSEHIEEFGGHSQAAGVNVRADKFEALKAALDAYLGEHYTREDFAPVLPVCGKAEDFARVATELEMLEPFGVGNRRPQFYVEAEATDASPLKPLSPHLSLTVNRMEFLSFNGAQNLKLLRSDLKKQLVFEYNISQFRGREYIKGYLRAVNYDGNSGKRVGLDLLCNRLHALGEEELPATVLPCAAINKLLEEKLSACAYGLCVVCHDRTVLKNYPVLKSVPTELFSLSSGSVCNAVLVSPDEGTDLSAFREIVFLDSPAAGVFAGKAALYAAKEGAVGFDFDCSREGLLAVFAALKKYDGAFVGESLAEAARTVKAGVSEEQTAFALAVFHELGLLRTENGILRIVRGVKTDLNNSAIYRKISCGGKREN